MTKADLMDAVYERMGLSRWEAAAAVDAVLEVLKEALQEGERIHIVNFGTFRVRQKRERIGRNPKTGEALVIAPRTVLTFNPSRILHELVSGGEG